MILQNWAQRLRAGLTLLMTMTLLLALSACNHDDDKDSAQQESGEVIIGLTDAPGDFTTYTVDVLSLTLTKANGAVVETVPVKTRVDFAQYTEMTEFLTAATIPSGVYVKASLKLDYSNADIRVENNSGESVAVSLLQDEQGNALSELDLNVRLEGLQALAIGPGVPAHLTLDFDLSATHDVDLNNGPLVTVSPLLLAEVNVASPKIHRARGPLQSVDTDNNSFRLVIRPFVHIISGGNDLFGTLKVNTTSNTVFDINGELSQGSAGLNTLAQQTTLSAVVVIGDLKFFPRRFEATEVRVGSSVAGGTLDVVSGNVVSRSGDVLNIKGATLIRSDGSVVFNDVAQVSIGDNTRIRRQLSIAPLDKSAISVGQRISVFGSLTDDQPQGLALDATAGFAHLQLTTLRASVVTNNPLILNVQSFDGRRTALFDFTGTGATEDADPANYAINTGNINLGNTAAGDVVKLRGFVNGFGKTESADFNAHTLVNISSVPGLMLAGWPLTSASALGIDTVNNKLTLDLTGSGLFHHISRAGFVVDLTQLPTVTTIEPANNSGLYFVLENNVWQLHTSFASYLADIQARLDAGGAVRSVSALGTFDDDTATMSVGGMTVHIM